MIAHPTRVDWEAAPPVADAGSAVRKGNRVLESIARQEPLRALLAFSELHEHIRNRHAGATTDCDLVQTERFVEDEVLQLICDRAQAITQADGVTVALEEGTEIVCRAAAGPLLVERGVRLARESEFLAECLNTGRILLCDDCAVDPRTEMDFSRLMGASASVLVPLRGEHARLGVLQAFSKTPFGFTDQDVRSFDLFAELVLSALKPVDQDRRINWLSDVAGEVLSAKPALQTSVALDVPENDLPIANPVTDLPATELTTTEHIEEFLEKSEDPVVPEPSVPVFHGIHAEPAIELPDFAFTAEEPESQREWIPAMPFLSSFPAGANSRPGLNVVLGLMAVAALFSAGVWWGMRTHEIGVMKASAAPAPVVAQSPPAPRSLSPEISDNLMDPVKVASDAAPLSPVPESKLAALPKITGVRHWSSSVGSTVVIDMEDQVPYEVHRLMSPERIYFDLHDTVLSPGLDGKSIDVGDLSLTRVRVAQPVSGVTRIVLDTKDGSNFSVSMETSPYRLVVELRGNDRSVATNRTSPRASGGGSLTKSAALSPLPLKPAEVRLPARAGKFRIVLDAGHGGWDLGTVGRQGLLEKDLVLDVTQRLGKLLQARLGSEVVFTRTDDAYLPLDQRADVANQSQADLFVSVHANYSRSADARGVETYYTNFFSAPGSKEIEKRENGNLLKPVSVSLSPGGLHEKIEESRRLAASIQRSLYATLAATSPGIRDRGIKDSAFAVLTGTTMPAILTEISFVSSPADEHNLQSESYRQQIAEALYKGIARYEQTTQHVRVAQLQTTAAHR